MKKFLIVCRRRTRRGQRGSDGGGREARQDGGDRRRLRPAARHQVVGPLGAVRQAGVPQGPQGREGQGVGHERAQRPAEAARAGRAVHLERCQGRRHHVARHRHVDRDPEEVHRRRRQDDRLRPPDRRRHRLGLRLVRRERRRPQAGAGRHRRHEGEEARTARTASSPSSGAARRTRTRSGSRAGTTTSSTRCSRSKKVKKGPAKFVPEWSRQERSDDLRADARPDEQQHPGRHRGERQHRRRGRRHAEGEGPRSDPAVGAGRDGAGRAEHHLGLADEHGLQVRARSRPTRPSKAAIALFKGKKPRRTRRGANGSKKQPTFVIPVVSITKANYKRLFKDGFLKKSDVCSGEYKKYCK